MINTSREKGCGWRTVRWLQPTFPCKLRARVGVAVALPREDTSTTEMPPTLKGSDFATLGLARGASVDEAKAAFRKLALKHHPDKGGDAAKFWEISEAFAAIAAAARRPCCGRRFP